MCIRDSHIAVRASAVHRFRPGSFSTTVAIGGSSNIVLYDDRIYDNGDFAVTGEMDVHGVGAHDTFGLWIVDSVLYSNRGDSFQAGHKAANTVGDIYIGRNDMSAEGENCVDIKEASNVVVSQNILHTSSPYSQGAVVFHDCPLNAAAIFNEFYDRPYGQSMASLEDVCASHRPVQLFSIRNTFHDIPGAAIQGWGSGKRYYVAGNSFTSVGARISIDNADPASVISEGDAGLQAANDAFFTVYG